MTRRTKSAARKAREKAAAEEGGAKLQNLEKMMGELTIKKEEEEENGNNGGEGGADLRDIEEMMIQLNIKREENADGGSNDDGHDQKGNDAILDCVELKEALDGLKNPKNVDPNEEKKANGENSAPRMNRKLTQKEQAKVQTNLVARWEEYFGKRELADWQRLCGDLGLEADLPTKTQCRKALKTVHVSIKQFLSVENRPGEVEFFKNPSQLGRYCRKNRMFMSSKELPKGDPLRSLRRKMRF
ncbi:uncharacterized protein CCOS01_13716 [Colletotrichum costaricense]|uniref:Uncharacterized protein n=1 Tax=Colletotrichum costaricense TaxID=1209916 RepID=A0AAI9YKN4_9PEZI|nr:uncharacterized protein CCOS01_13716 [Colletotrichum costaricense]KAK1514435.1 hypothetical protein CCOS01_13716 [Colletotrichum costaricense]